MLAVAFWLWSGFIALAAGALGAMLNCEYSGDCASGFPSWLAPWTWTDYYVFPETLWLGVAALAAASAYLACVFTGRRLAAIATLLVSLALVSYPFFCGLTAEGHALLSFEPLVGVFGLFGAQRTRSSSASSPPSSSRATSDIGCLPGLESCLKRCTSRPGS